MNRKIKRAVLGLPCLIILCLLVPGLPGSAYCRHALKKMAVKAEMGLAAWRGEPPRFVRVSGRLAAKGAKIEVLDNPSGWATLSDGQGNFILPDVMWYQGARYDFLIVADAHHAWRLNVAAPDSVREGAGVHIGELRFSDGDEVEAASLTGANSVSYLEYDNQNLPYYKELFDALTRGLETDEQKLQAINRHVAARLNYNENAWEYESPRAILARGSRYCGHLALALAALVEAGNYKTRILHLRNQSPEPHYDAVLEVYYGDRWHLYDPAFGAAFRNREGDIASYRELRLDPGLLSAEIFQARQRKTMHGEADWMPGFYASGFHHVYYFKKESPL
ncbi:MAG TPA: transglutaminase domain-containing protein, partial [Blastocatellia bacterium]|nr:transglutaminase domain-containing protein [Blastocatellia bacterium]